MRACPLLKIYFQYLTRAEATFGRRGGGRPGRVFLRELGRKWGICNITHVRFVKSFPPSTPGPIKMSFEKIPKKFTRSAGKYLGTAR